MPQSSDDLGVGGGGSSVPRTPSAPPPASGADVVVSAERLLLSRERVAVERVRFTKRIVTTTRTVEVPVRIEQLVVSHEPLPGEVVADEGVGSPTGDPGANALGTSGARTSELVILLHEEVPEFTLRVQPVERVTIAVRTVAEEETITAELRREIVEVDVVDVGDPENTSG